MTALGLALTRTISRIPDAMLHVVVRDQPSARVLGHRPVRTALKGCTTSTRPQ